MLSAVDSHTARHLYNECLRGPLAKNRTIILVTHAVGLVLPGTGFAVVLDGGSVVGADTPTALQAQGLFAEEDLADNGESLLVHHKDGTPDAEDSADVTIEDLESHTAELEQVDKQLKKDKLAVPEGKGDKFFKSESQETGSIGWRVWQMYFSFLGTLPYWMLLIAVFIGSQAAQIESNQWIRVWSNSIAEHRLVAKTLQYVKTFAISSSLPDEDRSAYYLIVYVLLNLLFAVLVAARTFSLFTASLRASRLLYGRLLRSLLGTRMRFWDSTPSGQIL